MIPEGFKNIEKILVSFLGESKNGISEGGQMQFPCPKCIEEKGHQEERKYNLEVNLYKLVYKCWSCNDTDGSMSGKLGTLIKRYGNLQLYESYKNEIDSLIKSKLYDLGSDINIDSNETEIRLPYTYTKIDLNKCSNNMLLNYLNKRKLTQDIIDKFKIGYTTWKEKESGWKNRIIMPSYDAYGDLNYFVGRDFTGKSMMKYKNCDADKTNIVFQESLIDFDSDIILCEGAMDCLYPLNAIALLGKTLKRNTKIYKTLMERANANIIICLDNDTEIGETKRIYNILNTGRLKGKILYIRLDGIKDFGELYEKYGKRGIITAIRSARQFNELDLLFE